MTKNEYLNELRKCLHFLPASEIEDAISYYSDYFDDSSETEEEIIRRLGNPESVAAAFRKEYNDTGAVNDNVPMVYNTSPVNNKRNAIPKWFMVMISIVCLLVCLTLLSNISFSLLKFMFTVIAFALVVLIIMEVSEWGPSKRTRNIPMDSAQTCSDIRSLDFQVSAGRMVITSGESFSVNTDAGDNAIISNISNGVWSLDAKDIRNNTVNITVPESFQSENTNIKVGAGTLKADFLNADSLKVNVGAGECKMRNFRTRNINIICGAGDVFAEGINNGDCRIKCGVGHVKLNLGNRSEDYSWNAKVGIGRVVIGDHSINGIGSFNSPNPGKYNININCGVGETIVKFI